MAKKKAHRKVDEKTETSPVTIDADRPLHWKRIPTNEAALYRSKDDYHALLDERLAKLEALQARLYAERTRAVIVIFQGTDTSGKDGAIRHVLAGLNPEGISVANFGPPTATELAHDFLGRVARALPARGTLAIFNRSYYEETLITRVHPELLAAEHLPAKKPGHGFWRARFSDIRAYEAYLERQGTTVVKIFLHLSKKEQRARLLARFDDPEKTWKVSESDVRERAYWSEYQAAFADMIRRTSTKSAPWHIVPADDKKNARLRVADILIDRLRSLGPEFPEKSAAEKDRLAKLRAELAGR